MSAASNTLPIAASHQGAPRKRAPPNLPGRWHARDLPLPTPHGVPLSVRSDFGTEDEGGSCGAPGLSPRLRGDGPAGGQQQRGWHRAQYPARPLLAGRMRAGAGARGPAEETGEQQHLGASIIYNMPAATKAKRDQNQENRIA